LEFASTSMSVALFRPKDLEKSYISLNDTDFE
jgi:hypothetical protein